MSPARVPVAVARVGRKGIVPRLAAVVCAVAVGCPGCSAPSGPGSAAAASDRQVLLALDGYNPMYQVDEDGRVIALRLPWQHLPDPVMAEIGKLTELQFIDLGSSTVTDDGLAQLKDLQQLRTMGLSGTRVTVNGLPHLEKLQGLQEIWLSQRVVTEAAAEKLKEACPGLQVHLVR
jgi:hypothetical protein